MIPLDGLNKPPVPAPSTVRAGALADEVAGPT